MKILQNCQNFLMNNKNRPCQFDDEKTCCLDNCTVKCPLNINYKRKYNNANVV